MVERGRKPMLASDLEISRFLTDVINGNALGDVSTFGKVGPKLAKDIKNVRDSLDLLGNYIELNADDLRESYKKHSKAKEPGDIPLSDEDFLAIPEYIGTYDGIICVNTHNKNTEVHFYKEIETGYIKILAVVSSERKSLVITKILGNSREKFEKRYSKKIKRDTGSPRGQTDEQKTRTLHTEARHTAGALSNSIIPQETDSVKPDAKKSKADADFESFSAEDFFREAANKSEGRSVSQVLGESEKSPNIPEAPKTAKKRGLSEGQAKKLEANYVNHKTFSRKEVAEVVDSITRKHLDFGEDYGVLIGKGRQEASKRFFA